jgi:hypothetical protein
MGKLDDDGKKNSRQERSLSQSKNNAIDERSVSKQRIKPY